MRPQRSASSTRQQSPGYDRARDLPRLICCWPTDSIIADPRCHADLIARLRRALRAERQRGIARHWSYDLVRHRALVVALRSELADNGGRQRGRRSQDHATASRSPTRPVILTTDC